MLEEKKVFISGPMTGIEDNNRAEFEKAEKLLRSAGFYVFNPIWLVGMSGFSRADIQAIDITALSKCNYIYMLDGWEKSQGACVEWDFARSAGIDVVNASWLEWYVEQLERRKTNEEKEEVHEGKVQEVGQAGS